MATQAIYQERRSALNQLVRGWDRRLRVQQVFTWLPRCLLPGLTIGVAIAIISRLRPLLMSGQILLLTGSLLALGFVAMLLAVFFWPRSSQAAARRFDILFGLQERVSTALELIDGRIHANEELVALQLDDAWETARGVRASESLPLTWRWREWSGVLAVALVLALLLIIPNPQEEKIAQDSAQRAAIDGAADQLRQITQDVAADAALEPQDRDQLLQALQTSTNVLQQPNVTPEEAFASLSDAQSALQEKSDELNQQANSGQAGLQAASDALRNFQSSDQQSQSQNGAEGVQSALNNLSQNAAGMNQQQQQDAASSLQQAAQAMQQANSDAAQAMQQASQSLQQGDPSSAQQSLGQASDSIQQTQQQQQSQQSSAQQLSQSAQSVQESANQVSQQSQQNQQNQPGQEGQSGQQGDQGQQNQQNQPGQDGQQQGQQNPQNGQPQQNQQNQPGQDGQPSQQGQPGSQGQQGQQNQSDQSGQQQGQSGQGQQSQAQDGQPGQSGSQPSNQGQPGQSGQSGQGQGDQPGSQGQQGQPSPGNGQQQDGSPSGQNGSASGSGAGDGAGDPGSENSQGVPAQGGQIPQNNNPDGQGQGQYDPVYAPQRIGGQSGSDFQEQLNGDASQSPVQQGDFSQNPNGNVNVPYDQVFSDYSNAANRALESDYIPLGLRDVVHDYFSSLEPGQSGGSNQGNSSQP
jgi:hypothetical protein